jgi:small subunit ribosomal protein S9
MAEAKTTRSKTPSESKGKVVTKKVATKKVAAKKTVAKKVAVEKKVATAPVAKKVTDVYVYAVGRRKTASVQARIYVNSKQETLINDRKLEKYFGTKALIANVLAPIKVVGMEESVTFTLLAQGGGPTGQSDASKLAIARALVKHDPLLRPILKAAGFLTRDARKVERKKPGLKKARRSPQWAKR